MTHFLRWVAFTPDSLCRVGLLTVSESLFAFGVLKEIDNALIVFGLLLNAGALIFFNQAIRNASLDFLNGPARCLGWVACVYRRVSFQWISARIRHTFLTGLHNGSQIGLGCLGTLGTHWLNGLLRYNGTRWQKGLLVHIGALIFLGSSLRMAHCASSDVLGRSARCLKLDFCTLSARCLALGFFP